MIGKGINRNRMLSEATASQGIGGASAGALETKLSNWGQTFSPGHSVDDLSAKREAGIEFQGQSILKEYKVLNEKDSLTAQLMGDYVNEKGQLTNGYGSFNLTSAISSNDKNQFSFGLEIKRDSLLKSKQALSSGK